LEAPFDVARARVVLADTHAAAGRSDAARRELAVARAGYARYGALHRVAVIDERLAESSAVHGRPSGTAKHAGTFRLEGQTWTVELGGHQARIKDLKGMRYLHRMLADPGREFHVLDLVAVESGTLRTVRVAAGGLPVLDDAARAAYRRRLADIDDDIEDATRCNDLGRMAKAEEDRHYLVNELTRAVGIGARARHTGDSSERARTAVARSLRYTLAELARHHRPAADHLRASVHTGTYCSYLPDPLAVVTWRVSGRPDHGGVIGRRSSPARDRAGRV